MQTRECGDCNLCCKLPRIDNFKGEYEWCKHCDVGVGCKIYESRPKICKDFQCMWKAGKIEEDLKPNKVGFYIVPERDESYEEKIFTIYCDTHKINNVLKKLKDIDHIDQDGYVWSYVIRYTKDDNDLAILDKKRFGKKLVFFKRGEL